MAWSAWSAWIDISLPLGAATPVYPGDPTVSIRALSTLDDAPCHLSAVSLGSHSGTHVDAPAHFVRGGRTLPEIPLERFNGPAWVFAIPEAPRIDPAHLEALWPPHQTVERVLLQTVGSSRWGRPDAHLCLQPLAPQTADWLVERGVRLVGIDALSIEHGEEGFPVHHRLLGAEVIVLEGLDLHAVPPGPCELLCLPLKLDTPDGAPVRALVRPTAPPPA